MDSYGGTLGKGLDSYMPFNGPLKQVGWELDDDNGGDLDLKMPNG